MHKNAKLTPRSRADIVERRPDPANHQGVRFSVATNGNFMVATNKCI